MATATKPPPPPPRPPSNGPQSARTAFTTTVGKLPNHPQRVGIYGSGGIGKSSLAGLLSSASRKAKFLDLDEGSAELDVRRVDPGTAWTWPLLLTALCDESLWADCDTVVVDSMTKAEELCIAHIIATVRDDRGQSVSSIEGYGYGKGYTFVAETFLQLFSALDRHVLAGRSVVAISHECTADVTNPGGENFKRYEPRLQSPASGKSSIRHRYKEWLDHLLFVGYDVTVNKDGKARGSGTRTIYPAEMPTHWAKSRKLADPIIYTKDDPTIWNLIF